MKNLIKFLFFVLLVSAGISALYDYRLKTGGLKFLAVASEKYSLAANASVDPKDVAALENLNRERRSLVSAIIPSVVSIKTSKKVPIRRQYQLDPSDFRVKLTLKALYSTYQDLQEQGLEEEARLLYARDEPKSPLPPDPDA